MKKKTKRFDPYTGLAPHEISEIKTYLMHANQSVVGGRLEFLGVRPDHAHRTYTFMVATDPHNIEITIPRENPKLAYLASIANLAKNAGLRSIQVY